MYVRKEQSKSDRLNELFSKKKEREKKKESKLIGCPVQMTTTQFVCSLQVHEKKGIVE